jgi:hypothetical protein
MTNLSEVSRAVLEEGRFCYLSATTEHGIHLTPVVFVFENEAVWATTARGTAKARAWKKDPSAAGLVQTAGTAVSFRGRIAAFDALDPATWPSALRRAPQLMRAAARFTLKNARYFAGYARDVRRLPISWMPPGRLLVSVEIHAGAVLDMEDGAVVEKWGRWGSRAGSQTAFRSGRGSDLRDRGVLDQVRKELGSSGRGALALPGSAGAAVLPVAWVRAVGEGAYYAVLPRPFLALVGVTASAPASLVLDRPSAWRAAGMRGVLLQGEAEMFVPKRVRRGREDLLAQAARAGPLPADPAVVRLRPDRAVWWKGWTSGTVRRR